MTDHEPRPALTRRTFVRTCLIVTTGALVAACSPAAPAAAPTSAPAAPKPTTAAAPKVAPTTAAAPTAAAKAAAKAGYVPDRAVKIGLILPLSGNSAPAAAFNERGMRHAMKEFEAKGWKFDVIAEDTKYDATTALRVTQKLLERDKVDALLGPVGSHEALAIRDTVNDAKTIMSTSSAVGRDITGSRCSTYIFRSTPTSYMYGLGYGSWLAQNIGKKAYVLTSDIAVGIEIGEAIQSSFEKAGGKVVGLAKAPLDTADFAPFIPPILSSGADFVTGFISGKNAIDALKAMHQFGLKDKMKVAYSVAFTSNDIIDAEGKDATEGVYEYVEFSESIDKPEFQAWVKTHLEMFPESKRVAHYTGHGYTAAKSVFLGMEQAGSLEPLKVSAAMEKLAWDAPWGPIKFEKNHQATLNMYITQIQDMKHIVRGTVQNQTDPNADLCKLA